MAFPKAPQKFWVASPKAPQGFPKESVSASVVNQAALQRVVATGATESEEDERRRRDKELAKVVVAKEDVALIAKEMEIPNKVPLSALIL